MRHTKISRYQIKPQTKNPISDLFSSNSQKQNPCLNTFPTVATPSMISYHFHLGILPKNPDFSNYFIYFE